MADRDRLIRCRKLLVLSRFLDVSLDILNDAFGLVLLSVDEQPAWTLRHVLAHNEDEDRQQCADGEGESPADHLRQDVGVKKEQRRRGTAGSTEQVGTR